MYATIDEHQSLFSRSTSFPKEQRKHGNTHHLCAGSRGNISNNRKLTSAPYSRALAYLPYKLAHLSGQKTKVVNDANAKPTTLFETSELQLSIVQPCRKWIE
jgi:hypothetical protein